MAKGLRASYFCELLHSTAVDAGSFHDPCGRTNRRYQPAPARLGIPKGLGMLVPDQRMRNSIAEIHAATSPGFEAAHIVERCLHERVNKSARVIIRLRLKSKHQVQQPVPLEFIGDEQLGVDSEKITG